jgi:sirohydrochlorin ferrochelatase
LILVLEDDLVKRAILLIAHGSRVPEANDDLRWLADQLRERCADRAVEVAYLELAEPDIETTAARLLSLGRSPRAH